MRGLFSAKGVIGVVVTFVSVCVARESVSLPPSRRSATPVVFMNLIHDKVRRLSEKPGRAGGKSDAGYVRTTVMNNVLKQYPEWVAFFTEQGVTRDRAKADASVVVYEILLPEVRKIYDELETKPNKNDKVLRDAATSLGDIAPQRLPEYRASRIRAFVPSLRAYQGAIVALKLMESSLAYHLASDTFQLKNDLAYLKTVKWGKGRDVLEERVGQLERNLSGARTRIDAIGARIVSLSRALITLIGSRFSTICIPGAHPVSAVRFERQMKRLESRLAELKRAGDYRFVIADGCDARDIAGVARGIYDLDPDRFGGHLLRGDPQNGLRNILGDEGPGVWFDTTRMLYVTSPDDFKEQLHDYFRQMARSGITGAKLFLAQLSNDAGKTDTVAVMFEVAEGVGVRNPAAVIASVAAEWGIDLGISVGGGRGTISTLDLGNDPVASARAFWAKYGRYCKNGIDLDIEGRTLAGFLIKEGQDRVTAFFKELCALARSANVPIQLSLCANIDNSAVPLAFLFKGGYVDSVNIMAYDGGDCAYLTPEGGRGNCRYGSVDWLRFLVDTCGVAPDKAMGMLHWAGQDAVPYSDISKTGWVDRDRSLDREVFERTGVHLEDMDSGVAFNEQIEQLRIDTIAEWNRKYPEQKMSSGVRFGSPVWWIHGKRVSRGYPLDLYPEAGAATREIVRRYAL
ncbi:MAG: hypothetical protein OXF02_05320 [Simkaniaceae bacterium]|nr:hypothetical protein [Simkaniaceae bacterium]